MSTEHTTAPSDMTRSDKGRVGWFLHLIWLSGLMAVALSACANPQVYAFNPTPIPTLIPATMVPSQIVTETIVRQAVESYPAGFPSAANGQTLYSEYCLDCHGPAGEARVPNARDFGDVDYMRGETPLDFYLAITEGVASLEDAENEMPAFGEELSSDERWDLVYYVWRFATSTDRLVAGREIYVSFCEECHGFDGRSQVLDAADLSDQRFLTAQSPSILYLSVTRGRGSMPAWQARLNQNERWMVIEYLRTFSYDPQVSVEDTEAQQQAEAVVTPDPLPCEPAVLAQTNPYEWNDSQAIAAGESIYQRDCSECHAEDGTGDVPQARDFTNPTVRAGLLDNPGERLCIVREGIRRMPGFNEDLSEDEIWQVLTFIAALGAQ